MSSAKQASAPGSRHVSTAASIALTARRDASRIAADVTDFSAVAIDATDVADAMARAVAAASLSPGAFPETPGSGAFENSASRPSQSAHGASGLRVPSGRYPGRTNP